MRATRQNHTTILHRLAELEAELRRVRHGLKDLGSKDPAAAEFVIRGAELSRERSSLERRLELMRLNQETEALPL
jgi:uncharacterized protein YeeX (DUF496 family)